MYVAFVLISIFVIICEVFVLCYIMKYTRKIHEELNTLKELAKHAKTRDDLNTIWRKLKVVNKKCWHKSFLSKIVEIRTIIETRYDLLP